MKCGWHIAGAAAGLALLASLLPGPRRDSQAGGLLPHSVYVWQRAWTPAVVESVTTHGTNFGTVVALAAEVSWARGQAQIVRVALDYAALRERNRPVGLALRIGPYTGPFSRTSPQTTAITQLAGNTLHQAKTNGLTLSELQLDFDCAESKLKDYSEWVQAVRERVTPTPVVITALPSWLNNPSCRRLISMADAFVLQVHSLERPKGVDAAFALCDPSAARKAVVKAAGFGKPFRVALPTYGYTVAFDRCGKFIGVAAEGPSPDWPAGTQLREVRSDPESLANLVRAWSRERPERLQGLIWYRLPVADDRLNWRWATLQAVMNGQVPRSQLHGLVVQSKPRLYEIQLHNSGQDRSAIPVTLALRWKSARLVASDAFQGFTLLDAGPTSLRLRSTGTAGQIEPGQIRPAGWLRLDDSAEVELELATTN